LAAKRLTSLARFASRFFMDSLAMINPLSPSAGS
jgi:hypothetical protein